MERSLNEISASPILLATPMPVVPITPATPARPAMELPQELKSGPFDEEKSTQLFFQAIADGIENPSKIKKIYDQRCSQTKQLSFDDLLKIIQYAAEHQIELETRLAEQKHTESVKVIQESKLPHRIAVCRDSHNQIALIIFLENLMAEGGINPDSKKAASQTKPGSDCYAITWHDELDLLELCFTKSSQKKEQVKAGYQLATALHSPYIIKYLLIEYSDTAYGFLSARGLFKLIEIENFKPLFQFQDLITICYSLFSALRDLHSKIAHPNLMENFILFKENDIFYVKLRDFEDSEKTKNNSDYKDCMDFGRIITARVLHDTNSLLDNCPSELYWQVICDIQDLARALVVFPTEESLITAEIALAKFVEIIQPVLQEDSSLNAKIGYMQNFLEKSSSSSSLMIKSRAAVTNFCLADVERLIPLSVLLQQRAASEVKAIQVQSALKLRRDMDKKGLEISSLKEFKPETDLNNIFPLTLAIYNKNWQLAIQLMDYFIAKTFPISAKITVMSFKSFPGHDCGLLNLVIEEPDIKETLRQELITKLLALGANRFYQSSIMDSPLESIAYILEDTSYFKSAELNPYPVFIESDKEKSFWKIINILYPDSVFMDRAVVLTEGSASAVEKLLIFAILKKDNKVIAGLMRCFNPQDYNDYLLVTILSLAIDNGSLREIRYLLITLAASISPSQFNKILLASLFCKKVTTFAEFVQMNWKKVKKELKNKDYRQNNIIKLWSKAVLEKDEAWSVFLLKHIDLSDKNLNEKLLFFFSNHGDHFCEEHFEKSLFFLVRYLSLHTLLPLLKPFQIGKCHWSFIKVLLKTKKVTPDAVSLRERSILASMQRNEQKLPKDHNKDDDKHSSFCFPHLTTAFVDEIKDFESKLNSKELSAKSYVCYNFDTQSRWIRLIDYVARRKRWKLVYQLLLYGADYDFRMVFQKYDGREDDYCSFFHFILNNIDKNLEVHSIVSWLLEKNDFDVLSCSNSQESALSIIDKLIKEDSMHSDIYLKFKERLEFLIAQQKAMGAADLERRTESESEIDREIHKSSHSFSKNHLETAKDSPNLEQKLLSSSAVVSKQPHPKAINTLLKSAPVGEEKSTRLFFQAISEGIKNPSKIRKIYEQRCSLTKQLIFDDLLKIIQYAAEHQLELEMRLTEQLKSKGPVKVIQKSELPHRIAVCRDSHNQIALIIFLENLMTKDGINSDSKKEASQTKPGSDCYAITWHDELNLLELCFIKSSKKKEQVKDKYEIATALDRPYILKYLLIEDSDTEYGFLSARGLFKLVEIENFKHLFQFQDLITICYSLFSALHDLPMKIDAPNLMENLILFKENDIFYVKFRDFEDCEESKGIFGFHKDFMDFGWMITARLLHDTNNLLDNCPSELYWQVICDIQDLARALAVCEKNNELRLNTAAKAFAKFVEIIQPVLQTDSSLNAKIGYMQKFLEKSSNSGSLKVENHARVANFCLADAERLVPLSVLLQQGAAPELKAIQVQSALRLRRDMAKESVEISLLQKIKPETDLNNIFPLAFAIYNKAWKLAILLMDYFIAKNFPISVKITVMSFKSFPSYDCGLLNLVIAEPDIEDTLRQQLITKLLALGANRFYQSTIMATPLQSIAWILQDISYSKLTELNPYPVFIENDKEKSFWKIVNILYSDSVFIDRSTSVLPTAEFTYAATEILLILAILKKNNKVIAGLMRCFNPKYYENELLVEILSLAIDNGSLREIRYLLITLTTSISPSQFNRILVASLFPKVRNFSFAEYVETDWKKLRRKFLNLKDRQHNISNLWRTAVLEKDEAWSVFLLDYIEFSDRDLNVNLLTFFANHGNHFCEEHFEKSLFFLVQDFNLPTLLPLLEPFKIGKYRWSVMKFLLKTKKIKLDAISWWEQSILASMQRDEQKVPKDHNKDDDKHSSFCFPHLTIACVNQIKDFESKLNSKELSAKSYVCYNSNTPNRCIPLIDYVAREKKWEFVYQLLIHGADYNFRMIFQKTDGREADYCSFFHFIVNKIDKNPEVCPIVSWLLEKSDLNVLSRSNSQESALSAIDKLIQKDSKRSEIYPKFKKKLERLIAQQEATHAPDSKTSQPDTSKLSSPSPSHNQNSLFSGPPAESRPICPNRSDFFARPRDVLKRKPPEPKLPLAKKTSLRPISKQSSDSSDQPGKPSPTSHSTV
jgi:hypothetical protein